MQSNEYKVTRGVSDSQRGARRSLDREVPSSESGVGRRMVMGVSYGQGQNVVRRASVGHMGARWLAWGKKGAERS